MTGASRREFLIDAVLAAALLAVVLLGYLLPRDVVVHGRFAAGVVLLAAMHAPLVWRRRAPVAVVSMVTAAFVFHATLDLPYVSPFAIVVAVYTVAAYTEFRTAATAGALAWAATLGGNWLQTRDAFSPAETGSIAAALAVTWIVGARIGRSRRRTTELEAQTRTLERERDERARAAVAEERARIARELHDVVSHNLSVMVVQAGGARRIADEDPERAREALASIETTGRQALTEMRRLVGLIRAEDEDTALEPTCGVDALGELVGRVRAAGVPVELEIVGDRPDLPSGIDVSVYRIVQESLTNVMKHAGNARARVEVRYEPGAVGIVVSDDGRGARDDGDGRGAGLVGMRERASLFGGTFSAGARPGGGFEVRARLPVPEQR